jgi:hypothetical protein
MMRALEDLQLDAFLARAESLAVLAQVPQWTEYEGLLRDMRQGALEELARCNDPGDFKFWQGAAHAFGEILERPGRVIEGAATAHRAEEAEKNLTRPELRAILGAGVDSEESI